MIYAIKNNQIDRNLYKANEDAFTSTIFERLNYLPVELFAEILKQSVYGGFPNLDFNKINEYSFWPHWNSEGTDNANYVEPDVFIRFQNFDLIIEAKRYDDNQQKKSQWKNEIKAYFNEYSEENKKLIFIALGGINDEKKEVVEIDEKIVEVYKCRWKNILETIKIFKNDIETSSHLVNSNFALQNILDDLILSFSLFGFSIADWFETFIKPLNIVDSSITNLEKLSWIK